MVLNKMHGEGESTGKLANPGSANSGSANPGSAGTLAVTPAQYLKFYGIFFC